MKIGILTYPRAYNYGTVLQAYALYFIFQKMGHDVEFIDYWPTYHSNEYSLLHFYSLKNRSALGKIKTSIGIIIGLYRIIKRYKGFLKFVKKYLNLSTIIKFKTVDDINGHYDVVIYGGDQIWRKQCYKQFSGFDKVYFAVNNLKTKHIAYAASMGIINVNSQDQETLKTWLKKFNKIMVRENDLYKLIINFGYHPDIVLDPVFLLSQQEWEKHIPINKKSSKYILFYHHNYCKEAEVLVDRLKKHYKYEVKIIRPFVHPFYIGKKEKQTATPIEFLTLYKNASFVVSTSFHGVAFSVIFKKQFYALGLRNNSERVKTLLSSLNISERYLDNIDKVNFDKNIDYSKINTLLTNKIIDSTEKLFNSINNNS